MSCIIITMVEGDRDCIRDMMRRFYASPAVSTDGSEEIFNHDIENCVGESPYLEGYVFEENGILLGYGMVAKSFSTEFGRPCMWIEDIYLEPEYRGTGIGSKFFKYLEEKYPGVILRLEVDKDNTNALNFYKKCGYEQLPYLEMKKMI